MDKTWTQCINLYHGAATRSAPCGHKPGSSSDQSGQSATRGGIGQDVGYASRIGFKCQRHDSAQLRDNRRGSSASRMNRFGASLFGAVDEEPIHENRLLLEWTPMWDASIIMLDWRERRPKLTSSPSRALRCSRVAIGSSEARSRDVSKGRVKAGSSASKVLHVRSLRSERC